MSSSALEDSTSQQIGPTRLIARWFVRARSQTGKCRDVDGLLSLGDHMLVDMGLSRGARTYMARQQRLPGRRSDSA